MLNDFQIDVIMVISFAVWLGVIFGGLSGSLAGALIRLLRSRRITGLFVGSIRALVPSAVSGVVASLVIALFQMLLCKPGHKSGWDVPVWSYAIQIIAILITGVVVAIVVSSRIAKDSPTKTSQVAKEIVWILIGAVLGMIMYVGQSFDGYFVLESNARPIRYAISGFVMGGIAVLCWRFMIALVGGTLARRTEPEGLSHEQP